MQPAEDYATIAGWKPNGEWNDWGPNRPEFDPTIHTHGIIETAVIPAPDVILNLAQEVYALNLPKGTANSLLAKLHEAYQKLMDGNDKNDGAAINKLEAFINAVEAQIDKKITPEAAAEIIQQANAIVATLGG